MFDPPDYVIITPARDEALTIEGTVDSVLAQTTRPRQWVIVSDGSTEGTDEIVARYANRHEWITLVRIEDQSERNFASKVHAFNAGVNRVRHLPYQVIANLDADVTFDSDYFEFLLGKLVEDPALGLVGTPFREASSGEMYDYRIVNPSHVSGACQVFRRECFEAIGGYMPVKAGAIDAIAAITARMKGWKTLTFTEKYCLHHRTIGTAQASPLRARMNFGAKDYALGNHPLFELFRCGYQMRRKPFLWGGLALGLGYLLAALRRQPRPVSRELIRFHRAEQMQRLRSLFNRRPELVDPRKPERTHAKDRRIA